MYVKPLQDWNTWLPILVTEVGNANDPVKPLQDWNA
jgi:hypothetical protein